MMGMGWNLARNLLGESGNEESFTAYLMSNSSCATCEEKILKKLKFKFISDVLFNNVSLSNESTLLKHHID